MEPRRNFYVYEHWRPDTGLPFYVGKGMRGRAGALSRRSVRHRHVTETLKRMALKVEVRKVFTHLDEETAFSLEQSQIVYWRLHNVDLVNYTDGGEGISGYKFTAEQKATKSAAARRPEVLAKISKRSKEASADPAIMARRLASLKVTYADPALRAKLSALGKAKQSDPEFRVRHREACIASQTPDIIFRRTAVHRAKMKTPEGREAMRVKTTLLNNRPETRNKISIGTKEALARPEVKARQTAANRAILARPEVRAKLSASVKAAWARRKAASAAGNLETYTCTQ